MKLIVFIVEILVVVSIVALLMLGYEVLQNDNVAEYVLLLAHVFVWSTLGYLVLWIFVVRGLSIRVKFDERDNDGI